MACCHQATSQYLNQCWYLWDVITCPCPWCMLLGHKFSYYTALVVSFLLRTKKRCPIVRCLFIVWTKFLISFFSYCVQYCIIFNHNTLKAHSSQNFGYSSFCICRSLFISFENYSIPHLSGEFLIFNWHMSSQWLQISWKMLVGVWGLLVVVVVGGCVGEGGRLGLLIRICQS